MLLLPWLTSLLLLLFIAVCHAKQSAVVQPKDLSSPDQPEQKQSVLSSPAQYEQIEQAQQLVKNFKAMMENDKWYENNELEPLEEQTEELPEIFSLMESMLKTECQMAKNANRPLVLKKGSGEKLLNELNCDELDGISSNVNLKIVEKEMLLLKNDRKQIIEIVQSKESELLATNAAMGKLFEELNGVLSLVKDGMKEGPVKKAITDKLEANPLVKPTVKPSDWIQLIPILWESVYNYGLATEKSPQLDHKMPSNRRKKRQQRRFEHLHLTPYTLAILVLFAVLFSLVALSSFLGWLAEFFDGGLIQFKYIFLAGAILYWIHEKPFFRKYSSFIKKLMRDGGL